ncbi:MAG: hypothetical protein R3D29_06105 [Nitratireductor sp.]
MKQKRWGRIVNFGSLQSFRAFPGAASPMARPRGCGANDPRHGRGMVCRWH